MNAQDLNYWSKSGSLSFPQILPETYCPLLNYMACAMLEPRPIDRPTLSEVLELLQVAMDHENSGVIVDSEEEDEVADEHCSARWTPVA